MAGMTTRTMVAGGVAGLGLAIGGLAIATADDADPSANPVQELGQGDRGGPGDRHRGPLGDSELAADLAEELGITEDQVRGAWEAVRDDLRPDRGDEGQREAPAPPSDAEREALQTKLAAALAKELDLPQADVAAALEKVRGEAVTEARTEARARLVERLDDAVAAGDLTAADKASVLKAFEAGVLGDSVLKAFDAFQDRVGSGAAGSEDTGTADRSQVPSTTASKASL